MRYLGAISVVLLMCGCGSFPEKRGDATLVTYRPFIGYKDERVAEIKLPSFKLDKAEIHEFRVHGIPPIAYKYELQLPLPNEAPYGYVPSWSMVNVRVTLKQIDGTVFVQREWNLGDRAKDLHQYTSGKLWRQSLVELDPLSQMSDYLITVEVLSPSRNPSDRAQIRARGDALYRDGKWRSFPGEEPKSPPIVAN